MKLLADEGVDRPIVERLRHAGHQVWYVAEMVPGIDDDPILTMANHESAVLMTADKDFGELVYRQRRVTQGVILLRLAGLSPSHKAEIVARALQQYEQALPQTFTVISPGRVRIRQPRT